MNQAARHRARRLALQALYQWQYDAASITEIISQHLESINPKKVDHDYFADLLTGIKRNLSHIDKQIISCLDRPIKELTPVELAVIRMATYELMYKKEIPYKAVINEALKVNKSFGTEEGFKYVNGVLDKIAKNVRTAETSK